MNSKDLSVVIPFHHYSICLKSTVDTLLQSPFKEIIAKIYLCHNGPDLDSFENARKNNISNKVELLHVSNIGLGAGCRIGIEKCETNHILITAADLPFGLSDIEEWNRQNQPADIVIGSKLHPESKIHGRPVLRRISTFGFMILKKIFIPIKLPLDTQGTIFIKTTAAKGALKECDIDGFFFTTELITFSILKGSTFSEVPVIYFANEVNSSVSPFKEGMNFFKNLIRLGSKIKRKLYEQKK